MIVGVGLDVVALERIARLIERYGERLEKHLLAPAEVEPFRAAGDQTAHLAGRFAAKEAVLKALGTGWAVGLCFTQIAITNLPSGAPSVELAAAALARSRELGGRRWFLSISHERLVAAAVAILEA